MPIESDTRPAPQRTSGAWLRWTIIPLAALLTLILIVFYALNDTVRIQGDSMLPALHDGDRVLRTRGLESPLRGDIVSFAPPGEESPSQEGLVKRIVAVGGDIIEIDADVAVVNGVREDASSLVIAPERAVTLPEITVPEGYVYVLGDNRAISLDSRFIGPVPASAIRGRLVAVFWPPARAGGVD